MSTLTLQDRLDKVREFAATKDESTILDTNINAVVFFGRDGIEAFIYHLDQDRYLVTGWDPEVKREEIEVVSNASLEDAVDAAIEFTS